MVVSKADAHHIDLILAGGRIWTGNLQRPYAGAIAVRADRIVAVGASDEILALRTSRTEVVDLRGRCAVPGFNDAHVHFSTGGFSLTGVQLRACRNEPDFRDAVARFAGSQAPGKWILHGEWDPEGWPAAALPNARLIDDVTPYNPVFVRRIDAHTALANTVAMDIAGVTKDTPDVPGGVIERYADGSPTGIFKDAAKRLIEHAIPNPTLPEITAAIVAAQHHAASHGVTSMHDMGIVGGSSEQHAAVLKAYQALHRDNNLRVRVSFHIPLMQWNDLARIGITAGFGDASLRIGALKGFADGSLGSRTACFADPYTDAPDTSGMYSENMSDKSAMYRALQEADDAGLQLAIHAIGDKANSEVLNLCERLIEENGARDRRLRIEHAQHLMAHDFSRFARVGAIASVQPYHAIDDGCWLEQRIGAERAHRAYAFRSLLDAGAVLALGSDWPVEPINSLDILNAAVTRRTLDGKHPDGWIPAEKLSLDDALRAYTAGSAYASYEEDMKGTIQTGKLADVVVLSDDIFSTEPNKFNEVQIDTTIASGEVIYHS